MAYLVNGAAQNGGPKVILTLKDAGSGLIQSIGQEIACHFSQDHTMVTKFLDFIHKHLIL